MAMSDNGHDESIKAITPNDISKKARDTQPLDPGELGRWLGEGGPSLDDD